MAHRQRCDVKIFLANSEPSTHDNAQLGSRHAFLPQPELPVYTICEDQLIGSACKAVVSFRWGAWNVTLALPDGSTSVKSSDATAA